MVLNQQELLLSKVDSNYYTYLLSWKHLNNILPSGKKNDLSSWFNGYRNSFNGDNRGNKKRLLFKSVNELFDANIY